MEKQMRSRPVVLIFTFALVIALFAAMSILGMDAAYANGQDETNYNYDAALAEGLPGVYRVQVDMNEGTETPTIGIPSVAKQNLTAEHGATKELPAIIMGAAVNYEVRTGPTEFTPIEGAELLPPYKYFRWGVMEEQTKEADGTTTTHRKLSGFDGSYYIVRVDVSKIIADAKAKAEAKGETLDGKYLHVSQQNNKALLVATGMSTNSYVLADPNNGGCKTASYPLADNAAAMKDETGNDNQTPYLDVILVSSAKNVAGADQGSSTAPKSDVDLSFYVDNTKEYNKLQPLDPNTTYTWPGTFEVRDGVQEEIKDEATYNQKLLEKFYNKDNATTENSASSYKVMGSDLEIDVAIDNNKEQAEAASGEEQKPSGINWLEENMDFWSMELAIAHQEYDNHTIILICEVPVLDALSISGEGKRSVILDVNSFDIQIANNTEQEKAGLTIGKNAQLRIKDGSNTAGAELAIGNNATMVIEKGGTLVIDETCTAEAEYDAASTAPGQEGQQEPSAELLSGEITIQDGGMLINHGVVNIEGTEGKPLDPAQQEQVVRDKKTAEIFVDNGGQFDNYGCLSLKGVLYVMGTLNNYGKYNDILTAYDPDKNKIDYHRGIQITWKDDVTQEGVEPGVLNVGIRKYHDAQGNEQTEYSGAEVNNYGDVVVFPGTVNVAGSFNNLENEKKDYAGHLYMCKVEEAIIPVVNPNDPLVVEKRVKLDTPRDSEFNLVEGKGSFNNAKGVYGTAHVELIHNGVPGELYPLCETNGGNPEDLEGYSVEDYVWSYDGNAHGFTVKVPEGINVKYGETENSESPTFTEIGAHQVSYVARDNENNIKVTGKPAVIIRKADPKYTAPTAKALVYTGAPQALVEAGVSEEGTFQYGIGEETKVPQTYSAEIPTGTDPGTYYVWYKVIGDENHNNTDTDKVKVEISKADSVVVTAPTPKAGLIYNGKAQALVTAGTADGGTMQYALGNQTKATGTYGTEIPSGMNAGTYYVWYKVIGDKNHNDSKEAMVKAEISKASIQNAKVVLSSKQYTYNGKTRKPSVKTVGGKELKSGTDFTVKWSKTPKNVGTYKMTLDGKGNYSGTTSATFKIVKAANPMKVKGKTKTIKQNAKTIKRADVIKVTKAKGNMIYKKVKGDKNISIGSSSGKVTVKNLKKRTYKVVVKVKAKGDKNYKASKYKQVTFKIKVE